MTQASEVGRRHRTREKLLDGRRAPAELLGSRSPLGFEFVDVGEILLARASVEQRLGLGLRTGLAGQLQPLGDLLVTAGERPQHLAGHPGDLGRVVVHHSLGAPTQAGLSGSAQPSVGSLFKFRYWAKRHASHEM